MGCPVRADLLKCPPTCDVFTHETPAASRLQDKGDVQHAAAYPHNPITVGARALTGPTADPNRRVQLINAPGAEVGPGQVATWGVVEDDLAIGFDFSHPYKGGSSKHFPFDWRPE